jgi:type II secretory pathway pseudopilin PulG
MKILKKYRAKAIKQKPRSNDGFTLIETATALTTLGICFAYAMPLFLYAKLNNAKTESRTGALMVAQRVFDKIRSQKITDVATNFNTCKLDAADPNGTTGLATSSDTDLVNKIQLSTTTGFTSSSVANSTTDCLTGTANYLKATYTAPATTSTNNINYKALGKRYATRVIFCEATGDCDANSRKFKVEVFGTDGGLIYELSGTYANFE